jgi:RHS repeat-associated protein
LTETFTYSFDDADNILSISKAVGVASPSVIETFTSDDDGNLLTRVSGGVTTTYSWTDHNRLASISTSDNSKKQSHTFGVNGFRRKKKDKFDVETTEYAAGLATAVSKAQGGDTITYLMGHRLMGFERSSDGAMFWFLTDALGSVRDICSGTDGAVLQSYDYTENGDKTTVNGSGPQSAKTWVGGLSVNDDVGDSGLYLMGHRHYDPSTARFLNRDPIGFDGGMNLYEYSYSSPTSITDHTGLGELGTLLQGVTTDQDAWSRDVTGTDLLTGIFLATGAFALAPEAALVVGGTLIRAGAARYGGSALALWGFEASGMTAVGAAAGGGAVGATAARSRTQPCPPPTLSNPMDPFNKDPFVLDTKSAAAVGEYYRNRPGWSVSGMGKGRSKGQGLSIHQLNPAGKEPTDLYIQYHPGTRRHFGGQPYWKVSAGSLGTERYPSLGEGL